MLVTVWLQFSMRSPCAIASHRSVHEPPTLKCELSINTVLGLLQTAVFCARCCLGRLARQLPSFKYIFVEPTRREHCAGVILAKFGYRCGAGSMPHQRAHCELPSTPPVSCVMAWILPNSPSGLRTYRSCMPCTTLIQHDSSQR